jgi:flagellar operon protein
MSFRIDRGQVIPVQRGGEQENSSSKVQGQDFQRMLQESILRGKDIKISAHAQQRMEERNIHLEESDIKALKGAMDSLEEKGARESLMLYKDHAFIASIRNRTIITSIDSEGVEVVTNIDSAIIVK